MLPDVETCKAILKICDLYRVVMASCEHSYSLCHLPGSVIGRLARSASCVLSPLFCVSIALQVAVSAPSALLLPGFDNTCCGLLCSDATLRPSMSCNKLVAITNMPSTACTPLWNYFGKGPPFLSTSKILQKQHGLLLSAFLKSELRWLVLAAAVS